MILRVMAIFSLLSVAAMADIDNHKAAVQKFFALANMEGNLSRSIDAMLDVQLKASPQLADYKPILKKFFDKYMSWKSLEGEFSQIYLKEFTEAEMTELNRFYETPVGRKALDKVPSLMAQGASIGQQRVQAHITELQSMIQEEEKKKGKTKKK